MEIFDCNYARRNKGVFLLPVTLLVTVGLLSVIKNFNQFSKLYTFSCETRSEETQSCNIFSGKWIPYPEQPYYNNETCPFIIPQLNCFASGRPDSGFLKYRWKPHDCDLPLFDATQFMKLVQGKSLAFVGDSMGRNQMQSLLCLINNVAHLEDITGRYTSKDDQYFKWWFSADYNFTIAALWSPYLVKSIDADPNGFSFSSVMNLYLDEADEAWARRIQNFDYVIISAGQWFYRPLKFYENGQVVGCQKCHDMSELNFYGYKKAFRTAFRTIINLKGFQGLTFLVTQSPKHFENGDYDNGGACDRTKPFTLEERQVYQHGDLLQALYRIQIEEFMTAKKEAKKNGLHFGLIDITDAMAMRPDAHPNRYGRMVNKNVRVNDCAHWCVPGPVDTWNEFLLSVMKLAREV
ncbi:PMR5 N-terminal domain [Sesbania bispinosa]|nr:PMR5 N-terminal domain [Sesbania bispinosa]